MDSASSSLAWRLREACGQGKLEEVRRLLVEEGAALVINDADIEGATALHFATGWHAVNTACETLGILENVETEQGAYQDTMNTAVLDFSQFPDTTPLVQLLLDHGAQVNQQTRQRSVSSLMCAASIGHPSVVVALLSAGANVKALDDDCSTALHAAAYAGHAEVVPLLLDAGADIEASNNDGYRALHYAAYIGHAEVVSLLLASGADIEARDNNSCTALHFAAHNSHAKLVRDLVSTGADVNTKDKGGLTPLVMAIEKSHPHVADDILTHGTNVNAGAITSQGLSAREYAEKKSYAALVRKLKAAERMFIAEPAAAPVGSAQGSSSSSGYAAELEAPAPAVTPLSHLQLVPFPEQHAKLADLQIDHTNITFPCHSSALAVHSKVLSNLFDDVPRERWASNVAALLAEHALDDVIFFLTLVHSPGIAIEDIMKALAVKDNLLGVAKLAYQLDAPLLLDSIDSKLSGIVDRYKPAPTEELSSVPLAWLPTAEKLNMPKTKAACMTRVFGILTNERVRDQDEREKVELTDLTGCNKELWEALSPETLLALLRGMARVRDPADHEYLDLTSLARILG